MLQLKPVKRPATKDAHLDMTQSLNWVEWLLYEVVKLETLATFTFTGKARIRGTFPDCTARIWANGLEEASTVIKFGFGPSHEIICSLRKLFAYDARSPYRTLPLQVCLESKKSTVCFQLVSRLDPRNPSGREFFALYL